LLSSQFQYIRVAPGRVVLKSGIQEMLVSGPHAESILQQLTRMLDGSCSREEIVASFDRHLQTEVQNMLTRLINRRMVTEIPQDTLGGSGLDAFQARFWRNFGDSGSATLSRLRQATVVVFGANLITRALLRSLLEMNVGHITIVDHRILNNELVLPEGLGDAKFGSGQLRRVLTMPSNEELAAASVLCAASDFSQLDALIEINRVALSIEKPSLPVWLTDHAGYVGPLNYPFETACLRCFNARFDSNNVNYDAERAVGLHMATREGRQAVGLLPPMAAILGEIAAMEIAKCIAGYPPSDAVSRVIEVNMLSFSASGRRVLKIPRCPDCSEIMRKPARSLTVGLPILSAIS
jgi:bacteriocin biosynthesis cyclodehydratase domain-containing protein